MADDRTERPISTWGDLLMRSLELGLGAATLTAETAQRVVNDLVNRGQMASGDGQHMVDRMMAMGREQRDALRNMVERTTNRVLESMDLARRSDVEELRLRVASLEHQLFGQAKASAPIQPIVTGEKDMDLDQE
jgi:polyhydroxyalkanoate synthesis regulator phasin